MGLGLLICFFLDHTQRHSTVDRISLDELSARRRDLYLTTHNTHNRQTSMPPVGFEPTISAGQRPLTYALDRVATGTGDKIYLLHHNLTSTSFDLNHHHHLERSSPTSTVNKLKFHKRKRFTLRYATLHCKRYIYIYIHTNNKRYN